MNGSAGGSEEDKQFVIANDGSFDTDYVLNINSSNGYVGLNTQAPTERLHVGGNIKITGDLIVNDDSYLDGAILQTGVNLYGTSDNTINLTNKSIIRFELNNTITGTSIGAGTAGQRIILYVNSGTGNTTIDVTNGLDFTEIVFSSIADSV